MVTNMATRALTAQVYSPPGNWHVRAGIEARGLTWQLLGCSPPPPFFLLLLPLVCEEAHHCIETHGELLHVVRRHGGVLHGLELLLGPSPPPAAPMAASSCPGRGPAQHIDQGHGQGSGGSHLHNQGGSGEHLHGQDVGGHLLLAEAGLAAGCSSKY